MEQNNKKLLLIVAAAVVGLYALYAWPYRIYADQRDDLEKQIEGRESAIDNAEKKIAQADKLGEWAQLNVDQALAESRMNNYVQEWIKQSRLAFGSLQQVRGQVDTKNPGFIILGSRFTASGNSDGVTHLLWALKSSPIPLRIIDFTVRSKKEGNDDLEVSFGVTTICVDPKASKTVAKNKTVSGAKP